VTQDGWVVVDAWNADALVAFCPKLNAAATFAMFLDGQESLARTCRGDFLAEIGDGLEKKR
jgi:hypothetical protein